ncbi:MAG: hypothetical protein KDI44_13290 [Thiothrix sp.]|nr:hypothetical protein [Thiothrix sp.]HPQ95646.1 hypothetical protein [Thiolinea sp.]
MQLNHAVCAALVLAGFSASGCQDSPSFASTLLPVTSGRQVATVYRVHLPADGQNVPCYRQLTVRDVVNAWLLEGDLVVLVDVDEGMYRRDDGYWLHVYPPLSHRPTCFVDTRYLIPYR